MRYLKNIAVPVMALWCLLFATAALAYTPTATKVTDGVYAFIGPLGQRSEENDGLNNNLGFIVTNKGVILIDSGASYLGARRIEKAISKVTNKPVKWVINTGSQDHRWLGNDYFAEKGAEIIAMQKTAETQQLYAADQMKRMQGFLKKRFKITKARPATKLLSGTTARITLGGELIEMRYTNAHYPGDAWVWLPKHSVLFTGDLVYVDRIFTVLPWSSVKNGQRAFHKLLALKPQFIVPGHGAISDIEKAKKDCGDYYDFLVNKIGNAAVEMAPIQDVMKEYEFMPQFMHLKHYNALHRTNMNRTYLEFEQF